MLGIAVKISVIIPARNEEANIWPCLDSILAQSYPKELYEIIAVHTGQPVEKVAVDCDRDHWMTSTEAKEYGLVDEVLVMNPKKIKKD